MRAGSRWSLISRDDSWFLLAKAVGPQDLQRFEEVAIKVLTEDDGAYELPAAERWLARIHKEAPTYSQALRTGIAETLALLAARPGRLRDVGDIVGRVEHVVRQLLNDQEWLRWLSLTDQLPLLCGSRPRGVY